VIPILAFVLAALALPAGDRKPIRLATLAPQGSSSHQILLAMGEKWRDAPDGGVKLIVNAGGLLGGEADVVSKMRAGQVQAGLLMMTFSLGTVLPLVATAYLSRRVIGERGRLLKAGLAGKAAFASVLVTAGILIWTGGDKALEAWLVARLPAWWVDLLAIV